MNANAHNKYLGSIAQLTLCFIALGAIMFAMNVTGEIEIPGFEEDENPIISYDTCTINGITTYTAHYLNGESVYLGTDIHGTNLASPVY